MNNIIEISIIIPCYNDAQYIQDAIDSLMLQTYQNFEIIIIDDASNDQNTIDILSTFDNHRIKIIFLENNSGPAIARNIGIKHAKGNYILPLDADDKIATTYLEKAKNILDANPKIGIVYCKAELFGEQSGNWNLPTYSFPQILIGNMIFATAMYRKKDWKSVGGYNENMIHGNEDYDFWLSLIEKGFGVYKISEVLFYYRIKLMSRTKKLSLNRNKEIESYIQLFHNHKDIYVENIGVFFTELKNREHQIQDLDKKIAQLHEVVHSLRIKNRIKKNIKRIIPNKIIRIVKYIKNNLSLIIQGLKVR